VYLFYINILIFYVLYMFRTWGFSFRHRVVYMVLVWFVLHAAALLVGRSRDRFPVVSLGIFSVVPPTEPCALRSTQRLKVSTRDFSWGKGGQCVWLTTYHPCSAETSRKSGVLTYPEPLGPPRPVAGHLYFFYVLCISISGLVGRSSRCSRTHSST